MNRGGMTTYLQTNFDLNSDKLVEVLDELPIWSAPFGLKLLDAIQYGKEITALDIGFGTGFPLTEIAMRLGESCKVYGIDPWETATKRAENKIKMYGIHNVEIIRGVAENIPLEDSSIDLITSNNGLNNVSDLDQSLRECSRVMKSDGQFVQTMNLEDSLIEFYSTMEKVLKDLGLKSCLETMKNQIHEMRKPLDDIIKRIESAGFTVDSVTHDQFIYKFVDGTTLLNHYFIQLAFLDGWKSIVPEEKQAEVFGRIEHEMNEQSKRDGDFTLSIPFVVIDCIRTSH